MSVRVVMKHSVALGQTPAGGRSVEVSLYDDIVHDQILVDWGMGTNARTFEASIAEALGAQGAAGATIVAKINSYGGDVANGVAMYNILRDLAAKGATIVTKIMGVAYSAASVVFMAGDERQILTGAEGMIHEARYAYIPEMVDAARAEGYAADLRRTNGRIADIYAERSGMSREEALALMAKTTYLSGQEALDKGFATARDTTAAVAIAGTPELMQAATGIKPSASLRFAGLPAAAPTAFTSRLGAALGLSVSPEPMAMAAMGTALEAARAEVQRLEQGMLAMADEVTALRASLASAGQDKEQALAAAETSKTEALSALRAELEASGKAQAEEAVRAFALEHSIKVAPSMPSPLGTENVKPSLAKIWADQAVALAAANR